MADAPGLGPGSGNRVWVQVPLSAPLNKSRRYHLCLLASRAARIGVQRTFSLPV